MPEISEIRIMAESLNAKFKDQYLHSIQWFKKPGKFVYNCAYTENDKITKLLPSKLQKVWSKGKKIILEFQGFWLVSIPLMTGGWVSSETEHQKIQLNFIDDQKTESFAIFDDKRGQAITNVYFEEKEFQKKMDTIGPDYFSGIKFEDYQKTLRQKKLENKEICWFLMEQKFYSGIGNYICSDVLYESKILPTRLLKNLSDQDLQNLYDNSLEITMESYTTKGHTIKDYCTFDKETGSYKARVYGRKTDGLGNKVLTGTFTNKRTSHYVVEVQT